MSIKFDPESTILMLNICKMVKKAEVEVHLSHLAPFKSHHISFILI